MISWDGTHKKKAMCVESKKECHLRPWPAECLLAGMSSLLNFEDMFFHTDLRAANAMALHHQCGRN